jgi:hypothetical protein
VIFAHTLALVLQRQKQQTRRLVKPNQHLLGVGSKARVMDGARCVYQVGKTYALQPGRGQKAVGRICLMGLRQEFVGSITEADARAEGFANRAAFLTAWRTIHKTTDALDQMVWVLEFELAEVYHSVFYIPTTTICYQ